MEKNITLSAQSQASINLQSVVKGLQSAIIKTAQTAIAPLEWLRNYYSDVCEKQLTMSQTLMLISTQVAFAAAVFPDDAPWVFRIVCGVWTLASALRCKQFLQGD